MEYIKKVRANVSIAASKKTSKLLEGLHRSIYKGKSLDFDDLREYAMYDDTRDIDWKASVRHGKLLVRQYMAYRCHNILFIVDTGRKMSGITKDGSTKSEVALLSIGTLAYIANKNSDSVGFLYPSHNKIQYENFSVSLNKIENILFSIEKCINDKHNLQLNELLQYANTNIRRKMVIFIVTDNAGYKKIDEEIVRKITNNHDLLLLNISDASISTQDAYDLDSNLYIPNIITKNKKIKKIEEQFKNEFEKKQDILLKRYRATTVTIDSESEIVDKIINLLERHNHAVVSRS